MAGARQGFPELVRAPQRGLLEGSPLQDGPLRLLHCSDTGVTPCMGRLLVFRTLEISMAGFGSIDFSFLIAFVLPGFVAVFSLSYVSEWVKLMFRSLLSKDASTGAAFVIAIVSLAVGIIVSAIRSLILDWVQHKTGVKSQRPSVSSLSDPNVLAAYQAAFQNTYRYSQASGNVMKFLVARTSISAGLPIFVCTLAAIIILFFSHRSLLQSTYERVGEILWSRKIKVTTA
jgi:hypothetical protein